MKKKQGCLIIVAYASLTACYFSQSSPEIYDRNYNYADVIDAPGDMAAMNDASLVNAASYPKTQRMQTVVDVPASYYAGQFRAPISHEKMDHVWVLQQPAAFYTIELADDERPAVVAKQLYLAPKKERMAEIKYQHQSMIRYKGLYGSYGNYEAAQAALQQLPASFKPTARIIQWQQVQRP